MGAARRTRLTALAAVVALVASGTPAAAACLASPVEDTNPQHGIRTGVVEPAFDDLWISGTLAFSVTQTYPYVERYDPVDGWSTTVLSPLAHSAFMAIAALSSTQAVAVGFEHGGTSALAVSFDGSAWLQTLGGSDEATVRGSLQNVTAVPGTATAYAVLAYGASNLLYWNGSSWSPVADVLPLGSVLAVSASSDRDVWAAGGKTSRYGIVHGLVERFDGRRWLQLPPPESMGMITSVRAQGADDAWVTGLHQQGSTFVPFAAHWNGAVWQQISLPLDHTTAAVYGDIYAASSKELWISASQPRQQGGALTSLWHWNGHLWRYVDGSEGWTYTPILTGFRNAVWFAGGPYRRTREEGNKFVGFADCTALNT
jgi:hypothetical protein